MKPLRALARLALLTLFILLSGAVFYYQERMLLADAPWTVFNILNSNSLFIQQHRYGSFITQIFPLLGGWLHLPLKWILILYSISFNLFYFGAGLFLYLKRQYIFTVLLALYFTLCVTQSYYWTNNEVHQGITWAMLLCGYWQYHSERDHLKWHVYTGFATLAFLAVFSHPIIIIITVYTFGFFLIVHKRLGKKQPIFMVILLCTICCKYYFSTQGWYDSGKISALQSVNLEQLENIFLTDTAQEFLHNCLTRYWAFSLIACASVALILLQDRYLLLLWVLSFLLLYFSAVCIVYPSCAYLFYIESEWMSISIIAALPLLYSIHTYLRPYPVAAFFGVVFIVSLVHITLSARPFQQRLIVLKQLTQYFRKQHIPKAIILTENSTREDAFDNKLIMSWGMPVEMLMLSTLEGKAPVTAVRYTEKVYKENYSRIDRQTFLNTFYAEKKGRLTPLYFHIDTSSDYTIIPTESLLKSLGDIR